MKKILLKSAFIALLFMSTFVSNAQVSPISPAIAPPATNPVPMMCTNSASGAMSVLYNTTGGTTSALWSLDSGPTGTSFSNGATGNTNASFSFNNLISGGDDGTAVVRVIVSNTVSGNFIRLFEVEIKANPGATTISTSAPTTLCTGENITLTATSADADSYVWYKDNAVVTGETNSFLIVSYADADNYKVEGVNFCGTGAVSSVIAIVAGVDLGITTQPANFELPSGATTATFSVVATGTSISYQWIMNGSELSEGGNFTGTNTATLTVSSASGYSGNNFVCKIDGPCNGPLFTSQAVLPIELVEFNGKFSTETAVLNWITASEHNNSHFEIERSYDGKEFNSIDKMESAGDSDSFSDYSYTDNTVLIRATSNTAYYRLKQVDFDGAYTYSDVITVSIDKNNDFDLKNIFQVAQNLEVYLTAKNNSQITVSIFDMNGSVLSTKKVESIKGYNKVDLNINNASQGLYIVSITGSNSIITKKVFLK